MRWVLRVAVGRRYLFVAVAPMLVGQDRLQRVFESLVPGCLAVLPAEPDAMPVNGRFPISSTTALAPASDAESVQVDYSRVRPPITPMGTGPWSIPGPLLALAQTRPCPGPGPVPYSALALALFWPCPGPVTVLHMSYLPSPVQLGRASLEYGAAMHVGPAMLTQVLYDVLAANSASHQAGNQLRFATSAASTPSRTPKPVPVRLCFPSPVSPFSASRRERPSPQPAALLLRRLCSKRWPRRSRAAPTRRT